MSAFEFYLSFFGLLLGLSVAQVAQGIGHAVVLRRESHLGWLTPLLALFVLIDLTSFWMNTWDNRDSIEVTQIAIYSGLIIALCYYLSAVLLFPVKDNGWRTLMTIIGPTRGGSSEA